jgi:hypothetical protein
MSRTQIFTSKITTMTIKNHISRKIGSYVSTKHVGDLISTYKKERWIHSSKRLGKPDSLSAWYSIEELEEFIATIKSHGGDGIKMYFGVYPAHFDKVPDYAGRQTIAMVATKSKQVGNKLIDKDLYINEDNEPRILAYNISKICPPRCETGNGEWGGLGLTLVDNGEDGITVI